MPMFQFEAKFWIILFWLIPFLWILGFYFNRKRLKKIRSFFAENNFKFLTSSLSLKKREWKRLLECLALFFFILALMQPQWGKSLQNIKSHGIELIILFDVSQSMLAEDVKPDRLSFAKREVNRFLSLSKGDKIGLLAFAGSSVLISPLTSDYSALKMYVESLNTNSISTQGTNYSKALLEAKKAFQRGGLVRTDQSVITRAILIISDGEDNEEGVFEVLQELKKEKIYIFSLLFGTEKGGVIPLKDKTGKVLSYQKKASGQVVLTKAKADLLKTLSLRGEGSFYHATYGAQAAFRVREDIEKLEKAEFEEKNQMDFKERYQIFLFFALLIALVELFLSERKRGQKKWLGRFLPFSFIFFLFFNPQDGHSSVKVILKNNKGVRLLVQGKGAKARNKFLESLKEEPMNPLHHFHLGLAFEQEGKKEKAIQQYETTLSLIGEIKDKHNLFLNSLENRFQNESKSKSQLERAQEAELKKFQSALGFIYQVEFKTLFNIARLYGEKKDFSKALKYYQAALEIDPRSKEVKENIEMLWQKASHQDQSRNQDKSQGEKEEEKEEKDQKKESERSEEENKGEKEEKENQSEANRENREENQDQKEKNQENKEQNRGEDDKNKEKQDEESSSQESKNQEETEERPLSEGEKDSKSFKGKDLKENDVLRIFEEIKNQEQKIRAKEFEQGKKEEGSERNW